LRREIFFLAYHLHWQGGEILAMTTPDRWEYVRLLVEQLERERDAVGDAS
jgi:hypothetical protein